MSRTNPQLIVRILGADELGSEIRQECVQRYGASLVRTFGNAGTVLQAWQDFERAAQMLHPHTPLSKRWPAAEARARAYAFERWPTLDAGYAFLVLAVEDDESGTAP